MSSPVLLLYNPGTRSVGYNLWRRVRHIAETSKNLIRDTNKILFKMKMRDQYPRKGSCKSTERAIRAPSA